MKNTIHIRNIVEILPPSDFQEGVGNKIARVSLDCRTVNSQLSEAMFLNAAIAILVLSGTGVLSANYKSHTIQPDSILLLSASHLFKLSDCSDDFKCLCLFVSKEFMEEMDSTDMIYKRIKYGVRLFNAPVVRLNPDHTRLLEKRIHAVGEAIGNTKHLYYKEMVLNCLFTFYLDLSDIIDRQLNFYEEGCLNRYESLIKSFIELLINNYRKEHKVEFYASELNVSAHYLTLIVKRVTGQSVCNFIFEMLYSDARTLLIHSKLSIQEITVLLNFSDQSSFGKFFKRKSGVSPADFRKNGI